MATSDAKAEPEEPSRDNLVLNSINPGAEADCSGGYGTFSESECETQSDDTPLAHIGHPAGTALMILLIFGAATKTSLHHAHSSQGEWPAVVNFQVIHQQEYPFYCQSRETE